MFSCDEHCTAMVEYGVKLPVLEGCRLPFACLALDGDEVSVHAANDVRYTRSAEAISRGHEVVDVKGVKQLPHCHLHFRFRCIRHNSLHS